MMPTKRKNTLHFWRTFLLIAIFALGLAIRLYDLTDAPLDFHSTRQLHSALMARGMYYSITPDADIPDWQRETSITQWKMEGMVEPPILEWLVALTYRLAGGAYIWIARLYAILFWMLAAVGVWLLARETVGEEGALVGVTFFLIYPYGVYASRSFQPETLLVMLLIYSAWSALRWEKQQDWKWAIIAGTLAGLSILIKAVAVFFIAGIWLGGLFSHLKFNQLLKNRQIWIIGILCFLPYIIFLRYASLSADGYAGQFNLRFFPQMWTQVSFYLSWLGTLRLSISLEWLLVGLVGILIMNVKTPRWMLMGVLIGYLLLGFTLPYHISSHDYYNLPLYLIISIGLAVIAQNLIAAHPDRLIKVSFIFLIILGVSAYGYEAYRTLKRTNYASEIVFWEQLSEQLGRSAKVVALCEDYGYRLAYWGWNSPVNWMNTEDIRIRLAAGQTFDFGNYFKSSTQGKDYFLITLKDEYEKQADLKHYLSSNFIIKQETDRYLIYDLHKLAY